jgi:hypothetical protein
MSIEYEDFAIQFTAVEGGVFLTRVAGPAGEAKSRFRWEEADGAGAGLPAVEGWWRSRLRSRNFSAEDSEDGAAPSLTPQEAGARLFRLVFRERLLSLLDQSLGLVQGRGHGLRLVLRFDLCDERAERLSRLPWELLYREETGEFLGLNAQTPVVRYLDLPRPNTLPPLRGVPRVLVAIAAARDLPPLDEAKEKANILTALRHSGIEPAFLEPATVDALPGALKRTGCQILHYVGHGGFEKGSGRGSLYLQGEGGLAQPVTGAELADVLERAGTVRLVFLNACETALGSGEGGRNPFAGVAGALVSRGVPAVLAMQAPVPDETAIELCRVVYDRLAQADTLEEAVSHARAELHDSSPGALWAIPVLFTRVRERIIPLSLFGWIWTALGLANMSLAFNTWSDTQSWKLYLPGLRFSLNDPHIVAIYGILWGAPLFGLLLAATRLYPLYTRGESPADRLPVAFGRSSAQLGSLRRVYQGVFFCLFLALPMAAQIHFFDKMDGPCVIEDTMRVDEGKNGKKDDDPRFGIWKRVPFRQLLDKERNRFKYRYEEKAHGASVTFYPFVEPAFFLAVELALLALFLAVCHQLVRGGRWQRARRRAGPTAA